MVWNDTWLLTLLQASEKVSENVKNVGSFIVQKVMIVFVKKGVMFGPEVNERGSSYKITELLSCWCL